jgi:hypothetical protein
MSAQHPWQPLEHGFDAKVDLPRIFARGWVSRRHALKWVRNRYEVWRGLPTILSYAEYVESQMPVATAGALSYPCLVHAWDNTPRSGANGVVLDGASPELFRRLLDGAIRLLADRPPERRLLFLKSWNEWAEGNHLEPDRTFGHRYLQVIADALGVTG